MKNVAQKSWEQEQREKFVRISVEQGGLVPCSVAAAIAGVTRMRYWTIGATGAVLTWNIYGSVWYSVREAQMWRTNDHYAGRPCR